MEEAVCKYLIRPISFIAVICAGGLFTGCNQQSTQPIHPEQSTSQPVSVVEANAHIASDENGQKLTDVAGRVTLDREQVVGNDTVPLYAKDFVGLYRAHIECDDGFVPCKHGMAEFILNLLPDGTVHRSIIHFGRVFVEKPLSDDSNTNYRKDQWRVNPEQTELVVHRKEGVVFYYKIIDKNHLVMDLKQISNDHQTKNKAMFEKGYPHPKKAYELFRDTHNK